VTYILDIFVFGILGLMSFTMLTLAIERTLFFHQVDVSTYDHPELLNVALTKNLTTIATIGSNAPYIGLLGTVIGILIAFQEMGTSGEVQADSIMLGLAMALKATAAGLVVAIPSIMSYNGLQRKVDTAMAQWKALNIPADSGATS